MQPTACSAEIDVPSDWVLKPSGVAAGAKFRLLFASSTKRNNTSSNIADYNAFVQARATAGHAAIRLYSKGFRVLGSTAAANARDNTCTRSTDTDAAVYWLNGAKVADNYAGLYDGTWDSDQDRSEGGGQIFAASSRVWTGTESNGTTHTNSLGDFVVRYGTSSNRFSPISDGNSTGSLNERFYGLSQVFVVDAARTTPSATALSITSSPALSDTYRLGETIEFQVTFSEAVNVRGTPQLALVMRDASDNTASEFAARYVSGTGTTKLVFAYTVAAADRAAGGLATGAAPLQLNGATITAVSGGFPATSALTASEWLQAAGSRSKVDGSLSFTDGVCERTAQVRDAIVTAVSAASDCSQVTDAHLSAITGTLFRVSGLTSLKLGDFAGLSGLGQLTLYGSGIETLPVGLFDGLDSLGVLIVEVGLTGLPKDIFRGLGDTLNGLYLSGNAIPGNRLAAGSLPDGVFESLTKLTIHQLSSATQASTASGPQRTRGRAGSSRPVRP